MPRWSLPSLAVLALVTALVGVSLAYGSALWGLAWDATLHTLNDNLVPFCLYWIVTTIATIYVVSRQNQSAGTKALKDVMASLGFGLIGLVAVLLAQCLFLVPYAMYTQARQQAELAAPQLKELEEIKGRHETLRREHEKLAEQITASAQRMAQLEGEIARLKEQLRDKRDLKAAHERLLIRARHGERLQAAAAKGCRMPDIPELRPQVDAWIGDVRSELGSLGLADYVPDFDDLRRCELRFPSRCSSLQPEFQTFFSAILCRQTNLKTIMDRLRDRIESIRP